MVAEIDWKKYFGDGRKTFRELRWWYCLIAANRRIVLIHLLTFGLCFVIRIADRSVDGVGAAVWAYQRE